MRLIHFNKNLILAQLVEIVGVIIHIQEYVQRKVKPVITVANCQGKPNQARVPRNQIYKPSNYQATFYVAKGKNCGNLLSLSTAQELGLVSLHGDKLMLKDGPLENILQKNAKVCLGKLKGEKIKLTIDKTQIPKAQQGDKTQIPYHIREKVKKNKISSRKFRKTKLRHGFSHFSDSQKRRPSSNMRRHETRKKSYKTSTPSDTARKIKFISTHRRVISSIYYIQQILDTLDSLSPFKLRSI